MHSSRNSEVFGVGRSSSETFDFQKANGGWRPFWINKSGHNFTPHWRNVSIYVRGEAVRFTQQPWWRKTRMMGLSESERISMICSAVLIQSTRVTDGQTDGIAVAYTRYSICAVARKNCRQVTACDNDGWQRCSLNGKMDAKSRILVSVELWSTASKFQRPLWDFWLHGELEKCLQAIVTMTDNRKLQYNCQNQKYLVCQNMIEDWSLGYFEFYVFDSSRFSVGISMLSVSSRDISIFGFGGHFALFGCLSVSHSFGFYTRIIIIFTLEPFIHSVKMSMKFRQFQNNNL